MNGKKTRLFVDMDGTLAEWQEGTPLEEVCAPGYFAQLPPNENMAKAMIRFWEYSRKNNIEVFILSAVFDDGHSIRDKNAWLDQYIPFIDAEHRIFVSCEEPKTAYINEHLGGMSESDMFNNISFTANPTSSSDAIVLFLANPSEWVKEYVEKMLKEQEWSLKHIRRQVSIDRYKEQKLVEYKKTPSKDLIQAKLFHDSVPKSGQVKVTLDIDGKQFVGSFDSKFFGYTGTNLDEAILPGAGFKYPDSFTGYYEFLRDNKINIDCKYNMFPFAFVKEIAAFRGDKIFWKKEA